MENNFNISVPIGMLKTHSSLFNASTHNITERVNFNTMTISDIRKFLASDPSSVNIYNLFQTIVNVDPEINTAIKMISYTVANSYLGPGYKSILDLGRDSAYVPESEESLKIFQQILTELQFKRWLPVIVRGLMRDGNVYFKIYRNLDGSIKFLELLPASIITILDTEYLSNKNSNRENAVIRRRDYYFVNEELINLADIPSDKLSDLSEFDERIISSSEILHFALNYEDSLIKDIKNRNTFGIYGHSPLEPLIFLCKMKLALMLDYLLYSRTGLPRWDFTIDLSNIMNLQNYIGDYYSRLREARSLAQEIFREFESQLHYFDSDPTSPTYGQYLPVEADHMFIHGNDVQVEQKGGIPASSQFLDVIKKCDMCICSVLGVPLSLFGYESGSSYAVSYITKSFMLVMGAGLLKEIENITKEFILREIKRRNLQISFRDFEQIELKFAIEDSDIVQQKIELEKAQITLAIQGFVNGLLTLNEARKRIGYEEIPGGEKIRNLDGFLQIEQMQQQQVPVVHEESSNISNMLTNSVSADQSSVTKIYIEELNKYIDELIKMQAESENT